MKATFIGNFTVDYSTEEHLAKTLEDLGFEVVRLQENQTNTNEVLGNGMHSDIIFWSHTHGWKIGGGRPMAAVMNVLRRNGKPTVAYHLDLWLGLRRQVDMKRDNYWLVEHFFTVDKLMADRLNASPRMPKGYYLPAGVYEPEAIKTKARKEFKHDVIFVGSKIYHPEWPYRPRLINWLEQTYGDRFALYGNHGKGLVRGEDLNALYASAKVVVGDTLCKNFTYPYYLSDRVFETVGRGGFIIHPDIVGLRDLYTEKELVTYQFNDFADLQAKIDYYIANPAERQKIKKAGYERTIKDHTYTQRLKFILDTLGVQYG